MLLRKRAAEILDLVVDKTEAELTAPDEAIGGDISLEAGDRCHASDCQG